MDRLSPLDAEFLHLEDESSPMHIASISVFEGPSLSDEEGMRLLASKLHLIPRYRQRIRVPPLELGRPVWVDDPAFDLANHVRRVPLPAPQDEDALDRLMARLMSQRLDRDRPLWEAWIVEGLPEGRWALVSKVHHCMVDGISGIDLLSVVLDPERDAALPDPVPWTPEPEPSGLEKVQDAWRGLAHDAEELARRVARYVRHPTEGGRSVLETTEGLVTFVRRMIRKPATSLAGTIGRRRAYAHASATIDDVRVIRKAFGTTLNDVVLALLASAYRALLVHRDEDLDQAVVRSLVPVSVRAPEARGTGGNRVSAILCDLPVHLGDARQRLQAVHEQMQALKASHMTEAGEWLTDIGNLAPPMVVGGVSRLVARIMHQLPQRAINTVTTNVPGPQLPLYCLGRQMLEIFPYVPITQGLRVGTAVLSYNGRLGFGFTGDADTTGDVNILAEAIPTAMQELLTSARQ